MMKKRFFVVFMLLFILGNNNSAAQGSLLDSMTTKIEKNEYTNINSILILQDSSLVYEHYFNGFSRDSLHDSRSSFKSITSLLVGIAIDKGYIKDVNQKVYSLFPEYRFTSKTDDWKKEMTIKNLLEMESGFDCEEFNGTKDCETTMFTTSDWVNYSLNLPMKNKPGMIWAYTSCNPMILSGIINRVCNMSVMNFAKKFLFDPMGITIYEWAVDPAGHGMTAGSFYIRPVDMIKIGQMVRDNGLWNGERIVSEKWIKESTSPMIQIPDYSFVKLSRTALAEPQPTFYGYYWYSETVKTKNFQENILLASGNGGQYIMIIRNLDLVVVFTQSNYNSRKAKQAFDILIKYILPHFEMKMK